MMKKKKLMSKRILQTSQGSPSGGSISSPIPPPARTPLYRWNTKHCEQTTGFIKSLQLGHLGDFVNYVGSVISTKLNRLFSNIITILHQLVGGSICPRYSLLHAYQVSYNQEYVQPPRIVLMPDGDICLEKQTTIISSTVRNFGIEVLKVPKWLYTSWYSIVPMSHDAR